MQRTWRIMCGAAAACLLAAMALGPAAHAATKVWSGNGNWGDAYWSPSAPVDGDDAVISSGAVTVNVNTAYLSSFTNNATVVFNGWSTILYATNDTVNGTVTHLAQSATTTNGSGAWVPDNRVYIACSNLTVAAGGKIDVSSCGYAGTNAATGRGPGGGTGGSAANYWGGGGSYGGIGCAGGQGGGSIPSPSPYGAVSAPEDPGSAGGGSGYTGLGAGGAGGGAAKIVASGSVTVNGTIAANGQSKAGNTAYGAGSGGAVLIACSTLTGTGTISVAGGAGGSYSGAGAGGRIAITVSAAAQDALPRQVRTVTAAGGAPGTGPGGMGTLYVSRGSVLLDPNSYLTVTNNTFDLRFPATFYCDGTILVTNGGIVTVTAAPTNGATAYGSLMTCAQDLIVATNSALILASDPTNGGSVQISVRDFVVAGGGLVSASSNGFGSGYGAGRGYPGNAGDGPSGGSYGGLGGQGSAGHYGFGTYGSSNAPIDPGSPGGLWVPTSGPGGPGGGLIWVQASRTIRVDGRMTTDGAVSPGSVQGAGAGGGIY